MNRVVITGQGGVSSLGLSSTKICNSMKEGKSGISELSFEDIERLSVKIGGQIHSYNPAEFFSRQEISIYDKFTQFAILSAKEAVEQSGIIFDEQLAPEIGVILGSAGGGLQTQDDSYRQVYQEGKNRVHPFIVPKLMSNAAASHLSIKYNAQGPSFTVSSACASSNHAMGQAYKMIKYGDLKVALTGGSESMLCFGGIKAWEGLRVMSQNACRPFCAKRDGMVQGEGAAVFVFENYEYAKSRDANIIAEIVGFSMTSDASDIVRPDSRGATRAMKNLLIDACLNPEEIQYINAHGTGTVLNDRSECKAIKNVFNQSLKKLMVSSTKSMHGHIIGGTGAIELLACIMAVTENIVPPTINYLEKDKDCDIDVVPNTARDKKVNIAMSNAFAFGGLNAIIAVKKI